MRAQVNMGKLGESEKVPMLQRLLQHKYSPNQQMPDHDIISEMMGHMFVHSISYDAGTNLVAIQDRWFRYHVKLALLLLLGIVS